MFRYNVSELAEFLDYKANLIREILKLRLRWLICRWWVGRRKMRSRLNTRGCLERRGLGMC